MPSPLPTAARPAPQPPWRRLRPALPPFWAGDVGCGRRGPRHRPRSQQGRRGVGPPPAASLRRRAGFSSGDGPGPESARARSDPGGTAEGTRGSEHGHSLTRQSSHGSVGCGGRASPALSAAKPAPGWGHSDPPIPDWGPVSRLPLAPFLTEGSIKSLRLPASCGLAPGSPSTRPRSGSSLRP